MKAEISNKIARTLKFPPLCVWVGREMGEAKQEHRNLSHSSTSAMTGGWRGANTKEEPGLGSPAGRMLKTTMARMGSACVATLLCLAVPGKKITYLERMTKQKTHALGYQRYHSLPPSIHSHHGFLSAELTQGHR